MKIEWDHESESLTQLEEWTTQKNGITLSVVRIPEADLYTWCDNRIGRDWHSGNANNLTTAMHEALKSANDPSTL